MYLQQWLLCGVYFVWQLNLKLLVCSRHLRCRSALTSLLIAWTASYDSGELSERLFCLYSFMYSIATLQCHHCWQLFLSLQPLLSWTISSNLAVISALSRDGAHKKVSKLQQERVIRAGYVLTQQFDCNFQFLDFAVTTLQRRRMLLVSLMLLGNKLEMLTIEIHLSSLIGVSHSCEARLLSLVWLSSQIRRNHYLQLGGSFDLLRSSQSQLEYHLVHHHHNLPR